MEIQLIIRAPNQNIDDQAINCNVNWTVLKLKTHLSEVYPSHPVVHEQKLIYSGRLLHDHLQLKDIIRHEDMDSSVHILHLVCNGRSYSSLPIETPSSSQEWSDELTPEQSPELSDENTDDRTEENVLRQRLPSENSPLNESPRQFPQIPVSTLPTYPGDPQMMAQMVAMQQMYVQYMSQYFQNITMSGTNGNPFLPMVSNIQTQQNNPSNITQENAPQQFVNQRNNAPAVQPVEENDFANRDWLDHLFLYFRFLILLCIVYFYTTPERFMLVIVVIVIAFLYHEGWFVRQGIADAVIGQRNRDVAEQNPNNANEQPPASDNEGQDGHELETAMDGEDPPHAQNPDAANNNNNNQVFSPLTFLATFFSSLIPEPPPPVNIN